MTTTLIIIGIFAGFFFMVVRPLQKRSGKYDVELPPKEIGSHLDEHEFIGTPGSIYNKYGD